MVRYTRQPAVRAQGQATQGAAHTSAVVRTIICAPPARSRRARAHRNCTLAAWRAPIPSPRTFCSSLSPSSTKARCSRRPSPAGGCTSTTCRRCRSPRCSRHASATTCNVLTRRASAPSSALARGARRAPSAPPRRRPAPPGGVARLAPLRLRRSPSPCRVPRRRRWHSPASRSKWALSPMATPFQPPRPSRRFLPRHSRARSRAATRWCSSC